MLRRTLANLARNHPKIVSILTGLTHSAHTSFDQLKIGSKSLGLPQRRDPKHQKSQPDPYTILLLYLEVYRDLHVHTTYTTTILVIHRLHCTAGQLPAKGTLSQYIQNIAGQRLSALRTQWVSCECPLNLNGSARLPNFRYKLQHRHDGSNVLESVSHVESR